MRIGLHEPNLELTAATRIMMWGAHCAVDVFQMPQDAKGRKTLTPLRVGSTLSFRTTELF